MRDLRRVEMNELAEIREILKRLEEILVTGACRRWMSLKEAARYAGISGKKLRQLIEEGEVRAKRLDGKWIVDRLSIDEFYESNWMKIRETLHNVFRR